MAIGVYSGLRIYDDRVQAGYIETLAQMTDAFNAASRNSLRLVARRLPGHYEQQSFFQNISSLVTRRDIASVAAATDLPLAQEEFISVKLNRKIGPVAQTLDSFRKKQMAAGDNSLSFLIGSQVAKAVAVDQLNSGLISGVNALLNTAAAAAHYDGSAGTMTTAALVDGLAKMGDSADRVVCWVMHSKVYYDLVKAQIAANIDGISNFNVSQAAPVTLNRPVLITDSTALFNATPTPDVYYTLGLTTDAILMEDSEEELILPQLVTGLENIVVRLQGEFAYNMGVKGYKWDTTNGGINPTAAALGTSGNWDAVLGSVKDGAGVIITTQ
jgi:hypothetical protein